MAVAEFKEPQKNPVIKRWFIKVEFTVNCWSDQVTGIFHFKGNRSTCTFICRKGEQPEIYKESRG
jgi:hypothetical protein